MIVIKKISQPLGWASAKIATVFCSLFVLAVTTLGCADDLPREPEQMVVEGWIDSDGYPVVLLTTSVVPGKDGELADKVLAHATVRISDGEREVVMTAGRNSNYMPPFRYYTFDMRGEAGKTYTVTADFFDYHATSEARMPSPTPIDRVDIEPAEIDTLRNVVLNFTAPTDVPAYYWLSMRDARSDSQPKACLMGTVAVYEPGKKISLPVLKPKVKIKGEKYVALMAEGESMLVQLNRVEEPVFRFWQSYDNMNTFASSPFISTNSSLPTNVTGGLGIWSACGASSMVIDIPRSH